MGSEVTGAVAGLERRVKNPTATGMRISTSAAHSNPMANVIDMGPELDTPLSSVLIGIPVAPTAPQMHRNIPGQPHRTTAAIVAKRPLLLGVMAFSF